MLAERLFGRSFSLGEVLRGQFASKVPNLVANFLRIIRKNLHFVPRTADVDVIGVAVVHVRLFGIHVDDGPANRDSLGFMGGHDVAVVYFFVLG